MAAPSSTFHCDSAIKSSSSSSTFSSFHYCDYPSRRRSISCSSSSSSLTCCCSSSSVTPQEAKLRVKRSPERNVIAPIQNRLKNENSLPMNNVGLSRNRGISVKDIFEWRSLWRRILFASKKVRSIILLNVITLIYASNIPVVKEVEAFVDPELFTVVRFVFSAIPFIPFVLQAKDDVRTRNAGIELGFWLSLGYLMQALGLLTSDAGRACFISMFTVIVVPLLDGMLGSIIPARTWFGALMSIVGVGMLESSGSPPCVGDLLNFISAVFFGIHMLRTEHISRSTTKDNFLPLLGYEVCVVAVFSTMWYLIGGLSGGMEELNPSSWTWTKFWEWAVAFPWIPALYTGIFSTGLCLWIEIAAMRDVSATETAIIYGLEPVWGAGFAWFLLGERWGINGWIGAVLVLGGSLAVQICGASSPASSEKDEENVKKNDDKVIEDEQTVFSTSMVVVSSSKDSRDYQKSEVWLGSWDCNMQKIVLF